MATLPGQFELKLRPCDDRDLDFFKQTHFESIREIITHSTGWDADKQDQRVIRAFKTSKTTVIQIATKSNTWVDIGVLVLERQPDRYFLESILLRPPFQNRGYGRLILEDVLNNAADAGLPVTLLVLKMNRARRLYESLGFTQIFEDRTHFHMKWSRP